MKIINNIINIDSTQWNKLINASDTASFFQTRECYDFYASLSFLEPFVFGVTENKELKGIACGYVIADGGKAKQFFSRRAIISGGVLLDETISAKALTALLNAIKKELRKKAIFIEVRNYHDYSIYKYSFESAGFNYKEHLNFHVPTLNEDAVLKQLSSTKRRDVKMSLKNGAEIIKIKDKKELDEFYVILEGLYKTKIKTPLFPYEFFEKLVQLNDAVILGVKYQENIIGGSTCVMLNNKIMYEWFICGLDGKYKNIFPSTLATWAAIEYAAKNGFEYFDMMGAGKPNEGYGVREFKARFGGELVEHGRFLNILHPLLYKIGKIGVGILKKR